jgi:hypothetical protein
MILPMLGFIAGVFVLGRASARWRAKGIRRGQKKVEGSA